jgi:cellobiose phosphorylase
VAPHVGRGGWTWYTGSAAWMYRLIVESLLGLTREADRLRFAPCLPESWDSITIEYRYGETTYAITMVRTEGVGTTVALDGLTLAQTAIPLKDDGRLHAVSVSVPRARAVARHDVSNES